MHDLVIVGCSGHGREVLDAVRAANAHLARWNVLGFVDDAPTHPDRLSRLGINVLGDTEWLTHQTCDYILGIGSAEIRARLDRRLSDAGLRAAVVVAPSTHVGADCNLAPGVTVFGQSTITTNVTLGRHVHVNVGCSVQHDTVVGDHVQISPGVLINGDCVIGDRVFIGTGAVVTRGCSVGADAVIGAGAVVLSDVAPGARAFGIPARDRSGGSAPVAP